jgi:hypothetical protein
MYFPRSRNVARIYIKKSWKNSGHRISYLLKRIYIHIHTIAENSRKSQYNLSTGQKKVPKGQFLQGSRNWEKCSALGTI